MQSRRTGIFSSFFHCFLTPTKYGNQKCDVMWCDGKPWIYFLLAMTLGNPSWKSKFSRTCSSRNNLRQSRLWVDTVLEYQKNGTSMNIGGNPGNPALAPIRSADLWTLGYHLILAGIRFGVWDVWDQIRYIWAGCSQRLLGTTAGHFPELIRQLWHFGQQLLHHVQQLAIMLRRGFMSGLVVAQSAI